METKQEWNALPATRDQLRRLLKMAMRTGKTFTEPITRGKADRRLRRAHEGVGREDLPPGSNSYPLPSQ